MVNERKKEVIDICLNLFITKGLHDTSTRDLSKAMKLQNAGLYYYFSAKDDAVIACAEEAAVRLETNLIYAALAELDTPEKMMDHLQSISNEMAPLMKFLASVCVTPRYELAIRPALDRLARRYKQYAEKFAEKLGCPVERIEPYVYMGITAASNYMLFNENSYIKPQMDMIKERLKHIQNDEGQGEVKT